MIDQVDEALREWITSVAGKDVEVSFDPPSGAASAAVSAYLVGLLPAPPLRGERRAPVQVALRYLVSTSGADVEQAHRLLGSLVLGALTKPEYEVDLEPPDPGLWMALGTAPRPCFYLKLPLRQELPEPEAKLVRRPLVVNGTQLTSVFGRVLGPGDVPLASAVVEIPGADLATETDYAGRFVLRGVPADPPTKRIRVRARRREMTVDAQAETDRPLVIRFEQLEG